MNRRGFVWSLLGAIAATIGAVWPGQRDGRTIVLQPNDRVKLNHQIHTIGVNDDGSLVFVAGPNIEIQIKQPTAAQALRGLLEVSMRHRQWKPPLVYGPGMVLQEPTNC